MNISSDVSVLSHDFDAVNIGIRIWGNDQDLELQILQLNECTLQTAT